MQIDDQGKPSRTNPDVKHFNQWALTYEQSIMQRLLFGPVHTKMLDLLVHEEAKGATEMHSARGVCVLVAPSVLASIRHRLRPNLSGVVTLYNRWVSRKSWGIGNRTGANSQTVSPKSLIS